MSNLYNTILMSYIGFNIGQHIVTNIGDTNKIYTSYEIINELLYTYIRVGGFKSITDVIKNKSIEIINPKTVDPKTNSILTNPGLNNSIIIIDTIYDKKMWNKEIDIDTFIDTFNSKIDTLLKMNKNDTLIKIKKHKYTNYPYGNISFISVITGVIYKDDKLIKNTINITKLFINNAIAYLGNVVGALFASYAVQKIPIHLWLDKVIKVLEEDIITKNITDIEKNDYSECMSILYKYKELRFKADKLIKSKIHSHLIGRLKIFVTRLQLSYFKVEHPEFFANVSLITILYAYDCLIDANSFETLYLYTSLIPDDTYVIPYACSIFGLINGIPEEISPFIKKHDLIYDTCKLLEDKI